MSKKLAGLDSALKYDDTHRNYKSGAVYDGQFIDNNKFGKGVFIWPSGDRYEGSYELNYRHGFGSF
jgi:hypothetical protein